ncbi:MAG: DUF3500 domain-containing protein [Burkholderiales bacterium]
MSEPGKVYRGYGIRKKGPGSARRWIEPTPELWLRNTARAEAALAQPFKGISHDGHIVPGLFPLSPTGISTRPIVQAGLNFIATLDPIQARAALHPINSQNWRKWCNWEQFPFRHGVSLEEMNATQRAAALDLLSVSLSARGYDVARNVMKLNHTLGEITGNWEFLGEWLYFLCIFGTPSATEPWGWQLDGHHLNLNYFVFGDQIVMTPGFWGAEPNHADDGIYAGLREFEIEERRGLELMRALSPAQQSKALLFASMLSHDHPPGRYDANNGRQQAVAFNDNAIIPYEGIRADALDRSQQMMLVDLIKVYVSHLRDPHQAPWLAQIEQHINDTFFAWVGGSGDEDTFYYKVHSPVLLIEFDMHKGVFLDNDEPEKFHVHITLRTPNGGDYGKDLLGQHLARHHHGHDDRHHHHDNQSHEKNGN